MAYPTRMILWTTYLSPYYVLVFETQYTELEFKYVAHSCFGEKIETINCTSEEDARATFLKCIRGCMEKIGSLEFGKYEHRLIAKEVLLKVLEEEYNAKTAYTEENDWDNPLELERIEKEIVQLQAGLDILQNEMRLVRSGVCSA